MIKLLIGIAALMAILALLAIAGRTVEITWCVNIGELAELLPRRVCVTPKFSFEWH